MKNILSWVGDKVDDVNTVLKRKFIRPALYNAATTHGDPDQLRHQIMECDLITKEEAVMMAEGKGCIPAACEYVGKEFNDHLDHKNCVKSLLEMGGSTLQYDNSSLIDAQGDEWISFCFFN